MTDFIKNLLLKLTSKAISRVEEWNELMNALEQRKKKWIMWGKNNSKVNSKVQK